MNPILLTLFQAGFILLISPMSVGLVRLFKARLQGRHGASPFLPYWTLLTLLRKELVISQSTSWVFRFVPFVVFGVSFFLLFTLPLISTGGFFSSLSDFILISGVLALGAIFLVLGGLDSASAFGGMGSSREMTIASLIEPTIIVTFGTLAVISKTSLLDQIFSFGNLELLQNPFLLFTALALLLIALAENARYPVDNPATHLELTMVHEAMVIEYSGPYLALLEYASAIKMTIFSLLCANLFFPSFLLTTSSTAGTIALVLLIVFIKVVVSMFLLALLESSIAKMRFYRLQEYLSLAFFVSMTGFILTIIHLL